MSAKNLFNHLELPVGYSRTWVWNLEPRRLPSQSGIPGCGEEGDLLPVAGVYKGLSISIPEAHLVIRQSVSGKTKYNINMLNESANLFKSPPCTIFYA